MKKGFTLIELVMVIVILGILAATALPRYLDLSSQAEESAAEGTLAGMRSAIAIEYAENVTQDLGIPATITADMFADNKIPVEVYSDSSAIDVVSSGTTPTGTTGGWMYDSDNGRVYINHTSYSSL